MTYFSDFDEFYQHFNLKRFEKVVLVYFRYF